MLGTLRPAQPSPDRLTQIGSASLPGQPRSPLRAFIHRGFPERGCSGETRSLPGNLGFPGTGISPVPAAGGSDPRRDPRGASRPRCAVRGCSWGGWIPLGCRECREGSRKGPDGAVQGDQPGFGGVTLPGEALGAGPALCELRAEPEPLLRRIAAAAGSFQPGEGQGPAGGDNSCRGQFLPGSEPGKRRLHPRWGLCAPPASPAPLSRGFPGLGKDCPAKSCPWLREKPWESRGSF